MTMKVEGTGRVRAQLELIALELVEAELWLPELEQRIEQAERRSGLMSLLVPACERVRRIAHLVGQARLDVVEAERRLDEVRLRRRVR